MSIFGTVMLCFCSFVLGVTTSGYVFAPERFPINKLEILAWVLFMVVIILWEIARK